jgi:cobalt-zinc-cadmium efflux system protein
MVPLKHHEHKVQGKNLGIAILLNLSITVAEAVGGVFSGSMALISDAAHNLSDVLSLVISYVANRLSRRGATEKETFGFRRSEILAAFFNSATLIIISVIIMVEAILRLFKPPAISADWIIILAVGSILVNGISLMFVSKDSRHNMNLRTVYLHLFSDMLTSAAVLAGGLAIKFLHWYRTDAVFSFAIAAYLIYISWTIFRSSLRIIMQFTPEEIDINKIVCDLEKIQGIKNIHHVHVWQINEHDYMFEAHVDISEDFTVSRFEKILEEIRNVLALNGISHSTIQPEFSVNDNKQVIH